MTPELGIFLSVGALFAALAVTNALRRHKNPEMRKDYGEAVYYGYLFPPSG